MRGVTLPEVLIAGSLLLLVLTVCGELTKMAYRSFLRTSTSAQTFRDQTLAADLMNRELRLCSGLLSMSEVHFEPWNPGQQDVPLVFKRYSPNSAQDAVIGYRLEIHSGQLLREEYSQAYHPHLPETQLPLPNPPPRKLASEVTSFVFQCLDPKSNYGAYLVSFEIHTKTGEGKAVLGSQVRVRSL